MIDNKFVDQIIGDIAVKTGMSVDRNDPFIIATLLLSETLQVTIQSEISKINSENNAINGGSTELAIPQNDSMTSADEYQEKLNKIAEEFSEKINSGMALWAEKGNETMGQIEKNTRSIKTSETTHNEGISYTLIGIGIIIMLQIVEFVF